MYPQSLEFFEVFNSLARFPGTIRQDRCVTEGYSIVRTVGYPLFKKFTDAAREDIEAKN
jgi:hypothetical protein